jgi:hypothetical protein
MVLDLECELVGRYTKGSFRSGSRSMLALHYGTMRTMESAIGDREMNRSTFPPTC